MQVRIYYRGLYFPVVAKKIICVRHFSGVQHKGYYKCHILHTTYCSLLQFSLSHHLVGGGGVWKKMQYRIYMCFVKMILLHGAFSLKN